MIMTCALLAVLQDKEATKAFEAGNELMKQKKYAEALLQYEACLKAEPESEGALFNGGLAATMAQKNERAAELWETLRKATPEDRKLLAKLVQTYQALGKAEKRDEARKTLFDQWAKLPEKERVREPNYCREQFEAGGKKVMAFENFELTGERAVRYRFSIIEDGKEAYHLSLGSTETTTQFARESGQIGKDERLFHLDGYWDKGLTHATYEFFKKEPTYDDTRRRITEVLEGKLEPVSSSRASDK